MDLYCVKIYFDVSISNKTARLAAIYTFVV